MPDNNDFKDMVPTVITVSQEEWDWLQALLDEPPKEIPKLKELFERADVVFQREEEDGSPS